MSAGHYRPALLFSLRPPPRRLRRKRPPQAETVEDLIDGYVEMPKPEKMKP